MSEESARGIIADSASPQAVKEQLKQGAAAANESCAMCHGPCAVRYLPCVVSRAPCAVCDVLLVFLIVFDLLLTSKTFPWEHTTQ